MLFSLSSSRVYLANTNTCPPNFFLPKVTAAAEQSYGYYSGNDGTDKDPQVINPLILPCIIKSVSLFDLLGHSVLIFLLRRLYKVAK